MVWVWRSASLVTLLFAVLLILGTLGHESRLGYLLMVLALTGQLIGELAGYIRHGFANRNDKPS